MFKLLVDEVCGIPLSLEETQLETATKILDKFVTREQ